MNNTDKLKYTTLLLDADMTLLDFDADEKHALFEVLEKAGVDCTDKVFSLYHSINKALWEQFERGEITKKNITERRFVRLLERLGADGDGIRLNAEYMDCLCLGGRLIDGAAQTCKKLFESGVELYIITNGTDRIQRERFKRSGLLPYIKAVFVSEAVGSQKPKKEYFDYVLSRIEERDKSKILVVGDSSTSDIAGGINAGLDTCRFNPNGLPDGCYKPDFSIKRLDELYSVIGL